VADPKPSTRLGARSHSSIKLDDALSAMASTPAQPSAVQRARPASGADATVARSRTSGSRVAARLATKDGEAMP